MSRPAMRRVACRRWPTGPTVRDPPHSRCPLQSRPGSSNCVTASSIEEVRQPSGANVTSLPTSGGQSLYQIGRTFPDPWVLSALFLQTEIPTRWTLSRTQTRQVQGHYFRYAGEVERNFHLHHRSARRQDARIEESSGNPELSGGDLHNQRVLAGTGGRCIVPQKSGLLDACLPDRRRDWQRLDLNA